MSCVVAHTAVLAGLESSLSEGCSILTPCRLLSALVSVLSFRIPAPIPPRFAIVQGAPVGAQLPARPCLFRVLPTQLSAHLHTDARTPCCSVSSFSLSEGWELRLAPSGRQGAVTRTGGQGCPCLRPALDSIFGRKHQGWCSWPGARWNLSWCLTPKPSLVTVCLSVHSTGACGLCPCGQELALLRQPARASPGTCKDLFPVWAELCSEPPAVSWARLRGVSALLPFTLLCRNQLRVPAKPPASPLRSLHVLLGKVLGA